MTKINPFKIGDTVRLTDKGYKHLLIYSIGQKPSREDIGFIKGEIRPLTYLVVFFSGASNGGGEGWNVHPEDIERLEV